MSDTCSPDGDKQRGGARESDRRALKDIHPHGGNLRELARRSGQGAEAILDFSANINPLGPPPWFRSRINLHTGELRHYPDPDSTGLRAAAGRRYRSRPEEIVAGNGATELLYALARGLTLSRAVIPVPAYGDYARAAALAGLEVHEIVLKEDDAFNLDFSKLESALTGGEAVFLGLPNNPTGQYYDPEAIRELARLNPSTLFVADESFAEFVEGMDSLTRNRPPNILVLISLTKMFAIPGLRLGCLAADAGICRRVRRQIPPWSVNALAQAVGERALQDEEYIRSTRAFVRAQRERLLSRLRNLPGLTVFPGTANFLLARVDRSGWDARRLEQTLLERGIAIRVCDDFSGLDERFFRIAVRTGEENERLCGALESLLEPPRPVAAPRRRVPAVMFQGTASNAGKSILAAAFCRILRQDGYRVAPFKAQNMSLNSYVTPDGRELSRAQALQAAACGLEPDCRMNPILLKPNSDTGSQVIRLGRVAGNMDVRAYYAYQAEARAAVLEAYDSLAQENEVMVLEGAGSPAEANLRARDFTNMDMARHARAPVVLVGDIDRGGILAAFIGTLMILSDWERALVKGIVINRFRGDASLLQGAIDYLERAGIRSLGVVPYLHDLGLPEEDTLGFQERRADRPVPPDGVEIAVIELPYFSNATDLDALRGELDVGLTLVRRVEDLGRPAAVIIPGSKNVRADLDYLRRTGLAERILELARDGIEAVGLCGGYQMLGREILDPHGIESGMAAVPGLGLLPFHSVLEPEKILRRVRGRHLPSGLPVHGYEIHHGRTTPAPELTVTVENESGDALGCGTERIWGTYLHGLFDADEFRRWFINRLRSRRGCAPQEDAGYRYAVEPALDRLAAEVRRCLDVKAIYCCMGLE